MRLAQSDCITVCWWGPVFEDVPGRTLGKLELRGCAVWRGHQKAPSSGTGHQVPLGRPFALPATSSGSAVTTLTRNPTPPPLWFLEAGAKFRTLVLKTSQAKFHRLLTPSLSPSEPQRPYLQNGERTRQGPHEPSMGNTCQEPSTGQVTERVSHSTVRNGIPPLRGNPAPHQALGPFP